MKYVWQYAIEVCIILAAQVWILRFVAILFMCLTTYTWLRRGDHIGR